MNYAKGAETIAIRNSEDEIVEFKPGGGDDVYTVDGQLLTLIMASGTPEEGYGIMFQASSGDTVYGDIDTYLGGMDSFFEAARQNMRIVFSIKQPAEGVLEIGEPLSMSMSGVNVVYCKINGLIVGDSPVSNCALMMMAQDGMFVGGIVFEPETMDKDKINDFLFTENLNKAGTLIYTKNDGKYYAVAADEWSDYLGTQVGVIVIPQGILPDGKARIVGIKGVDSAGTLSDTEVTMPWEDSRLTIDVEGLTNYINVPIVDPETNEITGRNSTNGERDPSLPSDRFSTTQNPFDFGTAWYLSPYAPSPYKDGALNPAYCAMEYTGGTIANCLSDFSGLENTQILCQSADTYVAANAAHLYKAFDGDTLEWYLPAMGELGFVMPRFNAIKKALNSVGGVALGSYFTFWSSSEVHGGSAWCLHASAGYVRLDDGTGVVNKRRSYVVRPFARLDSIIFPDNLYTRLQTKQDKVDNALTTESKEVVGAINEINSTVSGITEYLGLNGSTGTEAGIKEVIRECIREYLSGTLNQISLTESGGTLAVGFSEDAIFGGEDMVY